MGIYRTFSTRLDLTCHHLNICMNLFTQHFPFAEGQNTLKSLLWGVPLQPSSMNQLLLEVRRQGSISFDQSPDLDSSSLIIMGGAGFV